MRYERWIQFSVALAIYFCAKQIKRGIPSDRMNSRMVRWNLLTDAYFITCGKTMPQYQMDGYRRTLYSPLKEPKP